MTQRSSMSPRARRDTRREEIGAAARALRGGPPLEDERPPARRSFAGHDLAAVAILIVVFAAGSLIYRSLAAPSSVVADHGALRLAHPEGWLPPTRVKAPTLRLAQSALALTQSDTAEESGDEDGPRRSIYASPADPIVRIEIEIRRRPPYANLPASLALARAIRHGERYAAGETRARAIAGRDWLRTTFRYAYGGTRSPRVAEAVEYAAPSGDDLYVITFHGDARSVAALERAVAETLTLSAERAQRGGR